MMLRLCLLAVTFSLATGLPFIPWLFETKELPKLPRIVGGVDASPGEFPFQVSVQKDGLFGRSHVCGGSIIAEHYILTAAQCINGVSPESLFAVIGEYDLGDDTGTEQVIAASEVIVHEHYDEQTYTNDVGILHLLATIIYSDMVQPIELPEPMELLPAGTLVTAIGWGKSSEDGSQVDVLRKVEVPVVSDTDCRGSYGITSIADDMICAGLSGGGMDSCEGDAGGPLFFNGTQYGITSWGNGCGRPNYPGVYTEVAYFVDWINENLE